MKAKEYLLQLRKLDKLIENKIAEKQHWKDIAAGRGSSFSTQDRVQSSGSQQKMADAVVRYISIEAEIDEHIDRLVDKRREITATIEQLNVTEYDLLYKVYVEYCTLTDAADIMDKTYSWATTVHGRALKHVQDIIDKRKCDFV